LKPFVTNEVELKRSVAVDLCSTFWYDSRSKQVVHRSTGVIILFDF